jgi:hypothetical protein
MFFLRRLFNEAILTREAAGKVIINGKLEDDIKNGHDLFKIL